jgi:regulatory protein
MSDTLRERAMRCLARREHSRAELARKLGGLVESAEDVETLAALLDDLTARGFLSDERYAEIRVSARCARFGNTRLAHELRTQGVAEEVVTETLAANDREFSEFARALQVWQRKFDSLPTASEHKERARQTRFLLYRGFSGEIIQRVLRGDFEDENE